MKQKFKGFSLAEVLIVLCILGVIAILTLPTLTDAFNRKVVHSSVKRTVNLLEEIMADAIYGGARGGEYAGIDAILKEDELSSNDIFSKLGAVSTNKISVVSEGVYRAGKQNATFTYTPNNSGEIIGQIVIDGNGDKRPNTLATSITDNNDRFTFNLNNNGSVTPANDVARALIREK